MWWRIIFILLIGNVISPRVDSQVTAEVDSLERLIRSTSSDSVKMHLYNRLRRATYYSNSDQAFRYTQQYLALAEKQNNLVEMAQARFYMGNIHISRSEYDLALLYYMQAVEYFEETGDSAKIASVYNGIGAVYENNGNDSLSLHYYQRSQQISESLGDKRRSGLALNNMANIYKKQGNSGKAIACLEKAVKQLADADPQYLQPIRVNLANALLDHHETAKAQEIYTSVLSRINKHDNTFTYIEALRGLGNIARANGNYPAAVRYLEESFYTATESGFSDQRYDMMKDLIDAYAAHGDHQKGLALFYEYHTIKDSVFHSEKDRHLTETLQKYEGLKKDQALEKQQQRINEQNRTTQLLIAGTLILALFLLLVFLFYRNRLIYQKTIAEQTRELQQQKIRDLEQQHKLVAMNSMIAGQEAERKRIAKDLHDGLGGLLSTIKTYFSTLRRENITHADTVLHTKTNELIDEACVEVRRISHNMMPYALSLSGLEDALTDLGESLRQDRIQPTLEIHKIPAMDEAKSVMIYRVAQEIISNIRKHAGAQNVLLQILAYRDILTLTIEDDGQGFDTGQKYAGMGLSSIMSRVDFLDGRMDIDSQPGKGTTITIEIPIP